MSDKQTLILDSSQIDTFLQCPTLWRYQNIEHRYLSGVDMRAMNMGTLGHKLLETYYISRARGAGIFEAKQTAMSYVRGEDGIALIDGLSLPSEDVQSVLTTVEDYITISCISEFVPLSPDHVEVGFSERLYEDDTVLFILEGKIDLIGTYRNSPCIVDHKFHLRTTHNYERSIQFRNYVMVAKYQSLNVNHIVFADKNGKTSDKNFYIDPITISLEESRHWRDELVSIYFDILEQLSVVRSHSSWKRRSSCSGKYGRPCDYAILCNDYDPDTRGKNAESLFQIREAWKPW